MTSAVIIAGALARVGHDAELGGERAPQQAACDHAEGNADHQRGDRDREGLDAYRPSDLAWAEPERSEDGEITAPRPHGSPHDEPECERTDHGQRGRHDEWDRACRVCLDDLWGRTAPLKTSGEWPKMSSSSRCSWMRTSAAASASSARSTPTKVASPTAASGTGAMASIIVCGTSMPFPPPTVSANIGPMVGNTTRPVTVASNASNGPPMLTRSPTLSPALLRRRRAEGDLVGPSRQLAFEQRQLDLGRVAFDAGHRHRRIPVDRQLVEEPERGPRRDRGIVIERGAGGARCRGPRTRRRSSPRGPTTSRTNAGSRRSS